MPVFMTPDRQLTGQQPAGARPLARGLAQPSLMQRGGEPRSWCSWHLFLLLRINEERAPRLAVRDQPSPSKPVIPRHPYYTRYIRWRKAISPSGVPSHVVTGFTVQASLDKLEMPGRCTPHPSIDSGCLPVEQRLSRVTAFARTRPSRLFRLHSGAE
jgi:hypothetical protein